MIFILLEWKLYQGRYSGISISATSSLHKQIDYKSNAWVMTPIIAMELDYTQWASYQIRKIAGCACAGNAGNVFPRRRFQRKPRVSDPEMHHGTCVTHVPWCMSGSLTRGDGGNVPGIPGACAPAILRIWQEANAVMGDITYPCTNLDWSLESIS